MRAEDPLAQVRSRLEPLDIKTIIPYLVEHTTHVVQSKRNTAKGLQALINGKYIVKNSYIDALVYATSPSDLENEESLSPLEIDFEAAWPDPVEHLPPAGNEPVSRPAAAFAPNPARINVFEGYTFVFGDAAQFANLQAAINNGQGKALHFEVKDGVTTAAQIARFMKEAGGPNGLKGGRGEPGVVLVRFRSKGEYEPWSIELGNEVALMTDRRVIEQREFLDAILENDASPLCRPLPREDGSSQVSVSNTVPESPQPVPAESQPLPTSPPAPEATQRSTPRSKKSRVRPYVSKMQAFDDGFDMESVPVYTGEEDDVGTIEAMDLEPQRISQANRPLDTVEEGPEEDMVADLLPGARAMKRRREEMGEERRSGSATQTKPEAAPRPKRPKLDVLEAARKHREEEEQLRQAEDDQHPSQDVNVEELKNLAIIEEMDVPLRQPQAHDIETSERWDERWNGRKNFKKFRRKGEPRHARPRIQSVIVPLEEVTRKDFGIGEHYWVSNSNKTPGVSLSADRDGRRSFGRAERAVSQSEVSVDPSATPEPTPDSRPALSRARSQKRPREAHDSDSDDELRFRFRRKR